MGMALGILGMTTFISMFGMGYCLTSKGHLKDRINELEKEVKQRKDNV